ncbi:MAG TPA: hypothetical protein VKJ45_05595 [Blastocatellia bacterium]|nr:hypothetical protein [Blastocatellia bacterium]
MNMSLALSSASPQLRVSFKFDWPGGVLMELTIEGAAPGDGAVSDLRDFCRMFDNLRYSQSLFTSCAECDRHQVLALLRRSIERVRQSRVLANISVTLKDETGMTKKLALSDNGYETMRALEEMLRSVSSAYPGHAHGGSVPSRPQDVSVH